MCFFVNFVKEKNYSDPDVNWGKFPGKKIMSASTTLVPVVLVPRILLLINSNQRYLIV